MAAGLIGRKLGMTQIFKEDGVVVPVTVIEAGPCFVIQKKETEKDGYTAIHVGFEKKEKNVKRPAAGHFKKAGCGVFGKLKEFRVTASELGNYELGSELNVTMFKAGEKVRVTGFTKGRGFAGVVKRWSFGGGRTTHGSKFHRRTGSVGQNVNPGKIWKGKHMPGRYGNEQVTVKNLEVVKVVPADNTIVVKGAVPGSIGSIVYIKK